MSNLLDSLQNPPPSISTAQARQFAEQAFGLVGDAIALGGERDRNFRLETQTGDFLIKVANSAEPDELLEFQCSALRHIAERDPGLPVQRPVKTLQGRDWAVLDSDDGSLRVRAFQYLQGTVLRNAPGDARLMKNVGRMLGRLNRALRGFFHPAADHPLAWDLKRFEQLAHLASRIRDTSERALVESIADRFERSVHRKLPGLRAQVIHNDVSFHNTLVDPRAPYDVTGIFDFGDLIHAPLIQDLAVTAAEVSSQQPDRIAACAEIVAGFHAVMPLEPEEITLLPDLIAARLALAVILDTWSEQHTRWRDERDDLTGWRASCLSTIREISDAGPEHLESLFRASCGLSGGFTAVAGGSGAGDVESLWDRRVSCLGNAGVVSYERPLHLVRGEGVWLYDADGGAYLDAYNNVPHVGHCHPRVVEVVARQTSILNTNTRYLHDSILCYAERIAATLPEGLDVCYFVSSGSEANDLAWRLAKAHTGNDGGIVMDNAYHGVTDAVFDLSPAENAGPSAVDACEHVAVLPAPDDYRGRWRRGVPDRGRRYAQYFDEAIGKLNMNGHRPAAFFIDSILSSSGIFVPPPGYLKEVFKRVRAAGGLCVADEVQSGFGRIDGKMWGFEVDEVVPDIVTLGKPIANGYPMGLVVTRRDIADSFTRRTEFFSTTGGNPVACASALAVLDVMEEADLVRRAHRVGARLAEGIRGLASRHGLIGDVRGGGLFVGVELVKDRDTLEPAAAESNTVVNLMRDSGVLIGLDGRYGNVLKIRPPMVFDYGHVEYLLERLDGALKHT